MLSQLPKKLISTSIDLKVVMKLPEEALALKRVSAFLKLPKNKGVRKIIYER